MNFSNNEEFSYIANKNNKKINSKKNIIKHSLYTNIYINYSFKNKKISKFFITNFLHYYFLSKNCLFF